MPCKPMKRKGFGATHGIKPHKSGKNMGIGKSGKKLKSRIKSAKRY